MDSMTFEQAKVNQTLSKVADEFPANKSGGHVNYPRDVSINYPGISRPISRHDSASIR